MKIQKGMIDVTGGRVWYRRVVGGAGVPLLVLHGGPRGRDGTIWKSWMPCLRTATYFIMISSGQANRTNRMILLYGKWNVSWMNW